MSEESPDEKDVQKRKERLHALFKKSNTLLIIILFIVIFFIRFNYYEITKNQPLWWDEAEYMAAAKAYAGIGDFTVSSLRLPGFPLFASLFYRIGITSEPLLRFILAFIPSLLVIGLIFILLNEMYPDKRIAIISALILTVLWEHVFYSNRFQTENLSLIFEFLAIYIIIKVYTKKQPLWFIKPKYSLIWVVLFTAIALVIRPGNLVFVPGLFIFIVLLNIPSFLEDKRRRKIGAIVGVILLVLFVVLFLNLKKIPLVGVNYHPENKIAWDSLTVFQGFYLSNIQSPPPLFFYAFIIGILFICFDFWIKYPKIKKMRRDSQDLELKSNIANIILILSVLATFIFIIRTPGFEFRWYFPLLPGMLAFTALGIVLVADTIQKYLQPYFKIKYISIIIIIIISTVSLYSQWTYTNNLVNNKLTSYQPIKDSGIWLKENSNRVDIIFSSSTPQHAYYSERSVRDYYLDGNNSQEASIKKILQFKPRFIVASIFEPGFTPQWLIYSQYNQNMLEGIIMPYFNSSIYLSPQGQITSVDIKPSLDKGYANFTLVYPTSGLDGVFIYRVDYNS